MISIKELLRSVIGMCVVYLTIAILPPFKIGPGAFNLSDAMIMIIAFMYGPKVGIISALGAGLGDYANGNVNLIMFTIITKSFTAYLIGKYNAQIKAEGPSRVVLPTVAMIWMVFTNGIHDQIILGQFFVLNNILSNLVQGLVAIVLLNLFVKKTTNRTWE